MRPACLALLALLAAQAAAAAELWFTSADGAWNYSAHPGALAWEAAEAECVQGGGHLMHMDSQAEWEYVNPRALAIWRGSMGTVDPSWGFPDNPWLHAGYLTRCVLCMQVHAAAPQLPRAACCQAR